MGSAIVLLEWDEVTRLTVLIQTDLICGQKIKPNETGLNFKETGTLTEHILLTQQNVFLSEGWHGSLTEYSKSC